MTALIQEKAREKYIKGINGAYDESQALFNHVRNTFGSRYACDFETRQDGPAKEVMHRHRSDGNGVIIRMNRALGRDGSGVPATPAQGMEDERLIREGKLFEVAYLSRSGDECSKVFNDPKKAIAQAHEWIDALGNKDYGKLPVKTLSDSREKKRHTETIACNG